MNKQEVVRRMCESGVLPVFRTSDVENLFVASRAFHDAGVGCIEYTMTMPDALGLVERAAAGLPKELLIGVGSVMDAGTVETAVRAGARFIASPGLDPETVEACGSHGVVSVVGAITPTEIMQALEFGADVIKVFPATSVGPGFFSEVLGPLPGLHLMAAGGMTLLNVRDYVAAGAEIVTFLANGLDARAYAAGDGPAITRAAVKWVEAVRATRKKA